MKLAIKKRADILPDNFHYFLHPIPFQNDFEPQLFSQMGYIIVDVDDETGNRMLEESRSSLRHQLEVAHLAERKIFSERSEK